MNRLSDHPRTLPELLETMSIQDGMAFIRQYPELDHATPAFTCEAAFTDFCQRNQPVTLHDEFGDTGIVQDKEKHS
jgi:hypothetical protein